MADELEKVEQVEETVEETTEKEQNAEVTESTSGSTAVEIPNYLVEAGRAAGLDEDTLRDLAANDMDRLKDLGMAYLSSKFRADSPKIEEEVEEETQPETLGHVSVDVPSNVDVPTKQLISALVETQNKLIDALNGDRQKVHELERRTAKRDTQGQAEFDARIDGFFDKKTVDIPGLGTTRTLTPQQEAVRKEVYDISRVLKGSSLEEKLERAIRAYEGSTGTAEQTLRRKLDKSKTKFSPRPTGQKGEKTYKTSDEAAMAAMMEAASKAGIKFNES